jgi:hypothetical protein
MHTPLLTSHGPGEIFTRCDALANGVSSRGLTALVRGGQIVRIGRGVYRTGAGAVLPDPHGICRSMRVVLSHESAAAWLGADLVAAPAMLHVSAKENRGRRADCMDGVRLHRSRLVDGDVMALDGASVTTPVRTILDAARSMPTLDAVAIADSLCRLRRATRGAVEAAAVSLPRGPGRPLAIQVAQLIDPRAESVFESISRVHLTLAGLPPPVSQLNVYDGAGQWIARVDFAWPELRLILECDGYEFHGTREAFEHDRRRWNALTRAGWRVLVVTWRDVIDRPDYLVDLVGALVGTAA